MPAPYVSPKGTRVSGCIPDRGPPRRRPLGRRTAPEEMLDALTAFLAPYRDAPTPAAPGGGS